MRGGLFARTAISLGLLLCVALLTLGYVLLEHADRQAMRERDELAAALARTLAEGSLDALVSHDYELLERWVRSVMPGDYYLYAYLARANGQVLSHTDPAQVGRYLEALGKLDHGSLRIRRQGQHPVREAIYPARIGKQHLANAVIGYRADTRPLYTRDAALRIVFVIGLFLALLLVATLFLLRRHTRPLARLTASITATSLGAASVQRPDPDLLRRRDEVGALAREYDRLLDRLEDSYARLQDEERRLREMVQERTRELKQANEELKTFSYSVSHDLRAPLRRIDGFCQELMESCADRLDSQDLDFIRRIRAGSLTMKTLIDELLQLASVSRSELTRQPVDLGELVAATIARLREQEPEREVELEIAGDQVVEGDPALLGIMMENLVGNAWKYSSGRAQTRIEFGSLEREGERVYFIRDHGAGFDMRHADKLFVPFQRLHRAEEFEGVGVGLATVQRIVHRHGGRIWAEAEPGKGASFYFTLSARAGMAG
ncbi:MAG TPA: HAMP domain-containing protein [Gammaproteobacteria bacterium]|nr:HAMP domain-containing protein [Gammaproteobacteria bacterium]